MHLEERDQSAANVIEMLEPGSVTAHFSTGDPLSFRRMAPKVQSESRMLENARPSRAGAYPN